jgi:hypothetical protein
MRNPTKEIALLICSTFMMLLSACSSGDVQDPTPAAVATVTVTTSSDSILIGQTQTLSVELRRADGSIIQGQSVQWASQHPDVAVALNNGTVSGKKLGSATITATAGGVVGQLVLRVVSHSVCANAESIVMSVGEVRVIPDSLNARLCLAGGVNGADYAIVASSNAFAGQLMMSASNTIAPRAPSASVAARSLMNAAQHIPSSIDLQDDSWQALSRHEDLVLMDAGERARIGHGDKYAVPAERAPERAGLRAVPAAGDIVTFNGGVGAGLCTDDIVPQQARVVAVLRNVVVMVDTSAPPGGFSDQQLIEIASEFDGIGFDVDTLNFGKPGDIDGNGRVNLIFTPVVNQMRAVAVVMHRDFVSKDACAASNAGETVYMSVFDANSPAFANKDAMLLRLPYVIVHEVAHVINLGHAQGITGQGAWLHEATSVVAEELYFYARTGLAPGMNLSPQNIPGADSLKAIEMRNRFTTHLGFLSSMSTVSPTAPPSIFHAYSTSWNFLRYLADRRGGDQAAAWRQLGATGMTQTSVLETVFGSMPLAIRDWAVAQFADDYVPGVAAQYTMPSWNTRAMHSSPLAFPLRPRALSVSPSAVAMQGGGSAHYHFGVVAGANANVAALGTSGAAPVTLVLLRTR